MLTLLYENTQLKIYLIRNMSSRIYHFWYQLNVDKLSAKFSATKIHICFQHHNNISVENFSTFYHLMALHCEKSRELPIY